MESMFKKSLFSVLIIMIVGLLVAMPSTVNAASFKANKNVAVKTIGETTHDLEDYLEDEEMLEYDEEMLEDEEILEELPEDDEEMLEDEEPEDMPDEDEPHEVPGMVAKPAECSFLALANKIVYFGGETYSPFAFDMSKAKPNGSCAPGTAGLVISANKKNNTLVVIALKGGMKKIKYDQVEGVREGNFFQYNTEGDRLANLNLAIVGEKYELRLNNGANAGVDGLSVGFSDAFSQIEIIDVATGETKYAFYIINDGNGKISLDLASKTFSADIAAAIFDKIHTGGQVMLEIGDDGTVNLAGTANVEGYEVGAEAEATVEGKDVHIGGQANILGHTIGDKSNKIPVVQTVIKVIKTIKGLFNKLPALM